MRTTLRVVGFKVTDSSPSPTSVLTAREGQSTRTESPRSKLAEALKTETFHPLPRLRLKSTPRPQVTGFRKSLSHADLHHRDLVHLPSELSEATTPGSRASSVSTPMKIPSTLVTIHLNSLVNSVPDYPSFFFANLCMPFLYLHNPSSDPTHFI